MLSTLIAIDFRFYVYDRAGLGIEVIDVIER